MSTHDHQRAMHDFVAASTHYTACVGGGAPVAEEENAERRLAQAGDVLESALRQMIREEAHGRRTETTGGVARQP